MMIMGTKVLQVLQDLPPTRITLSTIRSIKRSILNYPFLRGIGIYIRGSPLTFFWKVCSLSTNEVI